MRGNRKHIVHGSGHDVFTLVTVDHVVTIVLMWSSRTHMGHCRVQTILGTSKPGLLDRFV